MYENTKKIIEQKRREGVFSGVVYHLIDGDFEETIVSGNAAIVPQEETMRKEALFDVASLTKVVCTTTVLLRLIERQLIYLDAPLSLYLPSFKNKEITIRHLLTHTSDIQTWIDNRDQLNAQELKEAYLCLQPGDNLGKVVKYTDAGTILLAFMLEELFQKEVIQIFREEVLLPLGMHDSQFGEVGNQFVVPTQQMEDGRILRGITHDPKARVLKKHAGNAGLFTSIKDLVTFTKMYLNRGEHQGKVFLKPDTVEGLLKNWGHGDKPRSLGWDLNEGCLFHTGYTGTFLFIDPVNNQAFIFLSNRLHPNDFRKDYIYHRDCIVDIYLKDKHL